MAIRAVIDTNIFVGACLGVGTASKVIRACLDDQFVALMGATLLTEYEDILSRFDLFTNCRLSFKEREELLDIFLAKCEWTRIYFGWRPNVRDEGDNHLIELAVAGGAQFLVTRNLRDFVTMELKFAQLQILSPEAFLKELQH